MKKSLFTLGLTLAILTGCSETATPEKVEPTTAEEPAAEAPKEEAPAAQTFTVGDTVEVGDVQVTLNSARKVAGGEFDVPQKDYFLVFDISVVNNGSEAYPVSSMMSFTLTNAEGRTQDMALLSDANGQLDGDVMPGKTLAGEVGYDVEDSEYFELMFTDDPFSADGQFIFKVTPDQITE